MTRNGRQQLWDRLQSAGLLQSDRLPVMANTAPWYVRVMMGISGWIAALLLLGSVTAALGFESESTLLILGSLACLVAAILSMRGAGSDFTDQFAFALSLSGQLQIVFGLAQMFAWSARELSLAVAVIEAVLFFAISGFVHRVWTVAAVGLALLYAIGGLQHSNLLLALVLAVFGGAWLIEFRIPAHRSYLYPLGYGLLGVVLFLMITGSIDMGSLRSSFVPGEGLMAGLATRPLLGAMLVAVVTIFATFTVLKEQDISPAKGIGLALVCVGLLVAGASIWAPGVGAGYLVVLIGFAHSNAILIGFGGFSLLAYLGHYYYALELSLLHKSVLLMSCGLLLLLARLLMGRSGLIASPRRAAYEDA